MFISFFNRPTDTKLIKKRIKNLDISNFVQIDKIIGIEEMQWHTKSRAKTESHAKSNLAQTHIL